MHPRRFRPALLVGLTVLALSAGLGIGRVAATEESPADADDGTYRAEVAPFLPHLADDVDEPVLVFVGDVPAETEAAIHAEFDAVQRRFRELGGGTADYTLYIGADRDGLMDTYRQLFGRDPPEGLCERSSHPGFAVINLRCAAAPPYRLDAHHFVEIRERLAPRASLPAMPDGFGRWGPVWLRTGAVLYAQHAYRVARGHEELHTSRSRETARAEHTTRSLRGISTWTAFNENSSGSRALGFLAVEWLAERAGDPAIFDYYRLLPDSDSWEEAFEDIFGLTVDDFYEAFEEYRARVAASDTPTITTTLYPGWNMVGWVGPETPASELFDALPALAGIFAWDSEAGGYRHRARPIVHLLHPLVLSPGQGLWLELGGDAPVEWTREASEDSVLLELRAGRNLVAWAGRDGTLIEEALGRFGERLVRAWHWDGKAQAYRLYYPNAAPNSLVELDHGDALLVELTEDARWWQSGSAPPPVVLVGEFTEAERAEMRGWMDDQRSFFAERWGVEAPIMTYIGGWDSLEATYRRVTGWPPSAWYNGVYVRSVQAIFLAEGGMTAHAHAHEYFHAIQHHLIGRLGGWGPRWMIEGSAIFATAVYEGAVSASETVEERIDRLAARQAALIGINGWPPLSVAERPVEGVAYSPRLDYIMGSLGVVWLSEHAGERSVVDFFRRMGDAEDWRDAFEGAFGLSVDDFHEHFEAYRAEVAPPLPHLVDDSDEPVLVFEGDVPVALKEAVREDFDGVQAFLRETFKVGTAHYTVLAAADPESIAAAHRRAFGADPGADFCSRSEETGSVVVISLACLDTSPHDLDMAQFNAVRRQLAPVHEIPRMERGLSVGGPFWLHLAASTYAQYAYRTAAGIEGAEAIRTRVTGPAAHTTRLLSGTSTWAGYNESWPKSQALGFLAVEWLVAQAGAPALLEYYRLLPESESWEEAFEGAFGMTTEDFYVAFEAYRAEVVAPFPRLTHNIDTPALVFVGDLPVATRNELRADFEAVLAFFDDRLGAPPADYTLYIGADAPSLREVYRQVAGRESTHSSYCSTPRGTVVLISLQCDPDLAWRHSLFVLSGVAVAGATSAGYPSQGPAWLTQGTHSYASGLYRTVAGSEELDRIRTMQAGSATRTRQLLSGLATSAGFADGSTAAGALGFLAVDWLVERAGEKALFDYYRRLADSPSWEDAFEAAFGIAVDDFYEAFEVYRAKVAPPR